MRLLPMMCASHASTQHFVLLLPRHIRIISSSISQSRASRVNRVCHSRVSVLLLRQATAVSQNRSGRQASHRCHSNTSSSRIRIRTSISISSRRCSSARMRICYHRRFPASHQSSSTLAAAERTRDPLPSLPHKSSAFCLAAPVPLQATPATHHCPLYSSTIASPPQPPDHPPFSQDKIFHPPLNAPQTSTSQPYASLSQSPCAKVVTASRTMSLREKSTKL